ncbi:MAG: hypothetical protein AAF849_19130 [Bacteroidota bacterium]
MQDSIQQIVSALERIQEANQMLTFHKTFAEPDENATANFQDSRNNLCINCISKIKIFAS